MASSMITAIGLHVNGCSDVKHIGKYEEYPKTNIVVVGAIQQNSVIYPDHLNPAYSTTYYLHVYATWNLPILSYQVITTQSSL